MGFIPLPLGSLVSNYNSRLFVCFFLLSISEVKVIPDFIGKTRIPPVPSKGSFFFVLLRERGAFMAELQRAKRASKAPLVRKIGNPSSRENLVMTSPYERPPSVKTLGKKERHDNVTCDFG